MPNPTERPKIDFTKRNNIRKIVKIACAPLLYKVLVEKRDFKGELVRDTRGKKILEEVPLKDATSAEIFNHYRHNVTNYEEAIDLVKESQDGYISDKQVKWCSAASAEVVLAVLRTEHEVTLEKYFELESDFDDIIKAAGTNNLHEIIELIKKSVGNVVDNTLQKSLIRANRSRNSYRNENNLQRCKLYLIDDTVNHEDDLSVIRERVNIVLKQRGTNKLAEVWAKLTDWESSEIIELFKREGLIRDLANLD